MFLGQEGTPTSKEAALARYGITPGIDNWTPPDTADVKYSLDNGQRNTLLNKLSTFNPWASPVASPDQPAQASTPAKDNTLLVAGVTIGAVTLAALVLGNALKG